MTEETAPERWLSLLEAAVLSPVRRQIKPVGMPKDPTGEVERQARMTAGRIPALARLLGMPIPPPPKPFAGERPVRPTRPPRRRPTERPATTADRPALVAKPLIAPPEGVVGTAEGAGVAVEALVVAVEEPAVAQEELPVAAQELVVAVEEPVVEEASSEECGGRRGTEPARRRGVGTSRPRVPPTSQTKRHPRPAERRPDPESRAAPGNRGSRSRSPRRATRHSRPAGQHRPRVRSLRAPPPRQRPRASLPVRPARQEATIARRKAPCRVEPSGAALHLVRPLRRPGRD